MGAAALRRTLALSGLVVLMLLLVGCTKYVSSYRAVGLVQANGGTSATLVFHSLDGRMVFKLKSSGEGDVKYEAKLGSGTATVYYDNHGVKEELFTIRSGEQVDARGGYIESGTVYIIVETDGKCQDGSFVFEVGAPPAQDGGNGQTGSDSEGETKMDEGSCKLVFDSFDGGGYEYNATIGDPELLSYTSRRDYGGTEGEVIDGASYKVIFTFTGLKPGTTTLTIACTSPIVENYERLYDVTVSDSLEVTLTERRMIARFLISRYGNGIDDYYVLERSEGECFVSFDGHEFQKADVSVLDALYEVFETYDVAAWDGFSQSEDAATGEQFLVEIILTDGTRIRAIGDFVYPDHYDEVMERWGQILHQIPAP